MAGLAEGFGPFLNAWEELSLQPIEYRELDDDRVLVLTQYSGRGKTSGLELDQMRTKEAHLYRIRDGKVIGYVFYFDCERALADLGLPSEAGSHRS